MIRKLILGNTGSGKTTELCKIAAKGLLDGENILFIKDGESKDFLVNRVLHFVAPALGFSSKLQIKGTVLFINKNELNGIRGMAFDTILFDNYERQDIFNIPAKIGIFTQQMNNTEYATTVIL